MIHHLVYKCRNCGTQFKRASPQPLAHLMSFHQISLTTWHTCTAGQQGVADLIGGRTAATEDSDAA